LTVKVLALLVLVPSFAFGQVANLPPRTNYALLSVTMSVGASYSPPWNTGGSGTVASAIPGVNGKGVWTTRTSAAAGSPLYASFAVPASFGPFTSSVYVRSDAGSAVQSITTQCAGSSPSTCTCGRSDGGACTAQVSGANCIAYGTVGVQVIRMWATAKCAAALTSIVVALHDGQFSTTFGTVGRFSGAQLEIGPSPSPFIWTDSVKTTNLPRTPAKGTP
jgi:hypothetical protein